MGKGAPAQPDPIQRGRNKDSFALVLCFKSMQYVSTKNKATVTHSLWKYLNDKKPKAVPQNAHPFYASFSNQLLFTTLSDRLLLGLTNAYQAWYGCICDILSESKGKILSPLGLNTLLPKHLMLVWD